MPHSSFDLCALRDAELLATAGCVADLAERTWPYSPATALALNEALQSLTLEAERRTSGRPAEPVSVELPTLSTLGDADLQDLGKHSRRVLEGLDSEARGSGFWRGLVDACIGEELRRLFASERTNGV